MLESAAGMMFNLGEVNESRRLMSERSLLRDANTSAAPESQASPVASVTLHLRVGQKRFD